MAAKKNQPTVDSATVAKNFINQYGKAKFKRFIKLLREGTSGEQIAEEYGVSRERVRQWKNAFGNVVQSYDVAPDIQKIAGINRISRCLCGLADSHRAILCGIMALWLLS